MQNRFPIAALLLAICFALSSQPVHAQMTLSISNPNLFVEPGGTVTFMGTFTNTSATDTFEITSGQLNDVFFMMPSFTQLPYAGGSLNSDFMVTNGTIDQYGPGATFTGPIFTFTVGSSALPGAYPQLPSISYMLYNIYDVTTGETINSIPGPPGLSITVVPEPSSGLLLGLALGGLGMAVRRGNRKDPVKLAEEVRA